MKRTVTFTCAIAFLFAGSALFAAETKEKPEKSLKQADVPKVVLDAVAKKYPKAKLKKFEQEEEGGKTVYEVELTSGKDAVSVDVSPEGKILAEETTIKTSALPEPVKAGLQSSKYKTWKLTRAERVIHDEKDDEPEYETVVQTAGEKVEVVLDRTGKITKEEPKSPKDHD